jgi:hypothetical protein
MKIVAVSGWKFSGKDTVAKYLIDNNGYSRVAFADTLKYMVEDQYPGVTKAMCDNPATKESPLLQYPVLPKDEYSLHLSKFMIGEFRDAKGRRVSDYHIDRSGAFLGLINNEAVQLYWTPRALCILEGSTKRTVTSDYWVQKAIDEMNNYNLVVISDLRYRSEIQQLRQAFGKNLVTVRVNRFDQSPSTDASERDLDNEKFDVVIENKGTLEELFQKVKELA